MRKCNDCRFLEQKLHYKDKDEMVFDFYCGAKNRPRKVMVWVKNETVNAPDWCPLERRANLNKT